jgi:hypothetical protein
MSVGDKARTESGFDGICCSRKSLKPVPVQTLEQRWTSHPSTAKSGTSTTRV